MGLCLNKPHLVKFEPKDFKKSPISQISDVKNFKSIISDKRLTIVFFHEDHVDINDLMMLVEQENNVNFYTYDMINQNVKVDFHVSNLPCCRFYKDGSNLATLNEVNLSNIRYYISKFVNFWGNKMENVKAF